MKPLPVSDANGKIPHHLIYYSVLFFIVFILLILAIKFTGTYGQADNIGKSGRMEACSSAHEKEFMAYYSSRVDAIDSLTNYCYKLVYLQDSLWDYEIRRSNFTIQQYQGSVLLTVVVIVTISGVALSALQLLAAFQLAITGKEKLNASAEIGMAAGKMSAKSSIAGVIILSISLLFFAVFVKYVLPLTELNQVDQEKPKFSLYDSNSNNEIHNGQQLNDGGYGTPPATNRGARKEK
jgi:hypothetical protein